MSFSTIQITSKGRALLARAQTGTTINFSRIKMGDGSMSGQAIDEMTDVISQKADLSINSLKVLTGGKAKVSATFTNQGLSTGFYWRELAVFATDPDNPSAADIMYCYGNAGVLADYIPAGGSQILERVISVLTIISNASNVTATIDSSNVYVTVQDAEATYLKKSLATAASQFFVSSAAGQWIVKTISDIKILLGLGSAAYTDSTAYATAAQGTKADNAATQTALNTHLSDYVRQPGYAVATGSANTYVATLSPTPAAYVDGMGIVVKIPVTNTGASTININGLGARAIVDSKGVALVANKIRGGITYSLRYHSITSVFQLQGSDSSGNAIPADLLAGKTASTDAGDITGTMPSRSGAFPGGLAGTIGDGNVSIPITSEGYYPVGASVYSWDANFIPANIVSGKSIFGLTGSFAGKRWASGTINPDGTYYPFRLANGSQQNRPGLIVASLTFKPRLIILSCKPPDSNITSNTIYWENGFTISTARIRLDYSTSAESSDIWSFLFAEDSIAAYVNSTGFRLPIFGANGTPWQWTAYE